jgi:hypothetical protein
MDKVQKPRNPNPVESTIAISIHDELNRHMQDIKCWSVYYLVYRICLFSICGEMKKKKAGENINYKFIDFPTQP